MKSKGVEKEKIDKEAMFVTYGIMFSLIIVFLIIGIFFGDSLIGFLFGLSLSILKIITSLKFKHLFLAVLIFIGIGIWRLKRCDD